MRRRIYLVLSLAVVVGGIGASAGPTAATDRVNVDRPARVREATAYLLDRIDGKLGIVHEK